MMIKLMQLLFIGVFYLMSTLVYGQTVIKLHPKESKSLTNSTLWTLNASCNVQTSGQNNKLLIKVLTKEGKVNGKPLSKGQTTSLKIKGNTNVAVSADPGTTVHLMNIGENPIEAVCYQ